MKKKQTAVLVVIVLLVLAAAVYYFLFMPPKPEGVSEIEVPEEPAVIEEPDLLGDIEPIEIDLEGSDALVRKLVEQISGNPTLARWLTNDYLIRKFVTAVDLIAKGDSPRRPMDFIEIDGDFQVFDSEGRLYLDPADYARYNRFAGVVSSLDAKGVAILYTQLRLPVEQAYSEMGYPGASFDATFEKAMLNLLDTPVVEDRIYIVRDVLTYAMEDPRLENLNNAQKHLLRMGPENTKAIQLKLKEIAYYLGFKSVDRQ